MLRQSRLPRQHDTIGKQGQNPFEPSRASFARANLYALFWTSIMNIHRSKATSVGFLCLEAAVESTSWCELCKSFLGLYTQKSFHGDSLQQLTGGTIQGRRNEGQDFAAASCAGPAWRLNAYKLQSCFGQTVVATASHGRRSTDFV